MTGLSRATRASDVDMMQVLPAVVLVVVLLIGGDWVGEAAEQADAQRALHGQALSIAMVQANEAMHADFATLEPTAAYVPLSRVSLTGDGEDADGASPLGYEVERRVTNLDAAGSLRRIEIRVGYEQLDGERTWVEIATVRQDLETAQALRQRKGARAAS